MNQQDNFDEVQTTKELNSDEGQAPKDLEFDEVQATKDLEFDEVQAIKDLKKEAQTIIRTFNTFIRVKVSEVEVLEKLNRALDSMPSAADMAAVTEEFQARAQSVLEVARQERIDNFRRIETGYIQRVRESGKLLREVNSGWRIGPLEMQVEREFGRISFWYNRERLVKGKSIATVEDIEKIEEKSLNMLKKAAIPAEILSQVFWEAYQEAQKKSTRKRKASLVSLTDFYRELRIVLVRHKIAGRVALSRKITQYADFPRWTFLYNLDLYRGLAQEIEETKRLALQTGSMSEVNKGNGYVINGLEAQNEYKTMCYVLPMSGD